MLNLARFPTQLQYNVVIHNPTVKLVQFPPKSHSSNSARLSFGDVIVKTQSGLRCNALGTKEKGGFSVKEMDGSDEFDDEDFDDEFLDSEMEDGGSGYDDDEVVIPLKNMKQWLENRPRGFGEGKVYDTSIEDKLMEEIEQSRIAQLANVNKLKNNPLNRSPKKETSKKDKDLQHSYDGFRVRLVNLPKKKNIHRDLRVAFQGVPGIVNIVPVVSGNEKTRDPVCKGIAFVDFKNMDEAQRFMQNFSGKAIFFGKVEKQIKCEMVKPQAQVPKPECDKKSDPNSDEDRDAVSEADGPVAYSLEESELDGDADQMHVSAQWEEEDDGGNDGTSTTADSHLADEQKEGEESAINSCSLKQTRRPKKHQKKVASTRVKGNAPKLNIPGSAKKLKIREQAVLSGVFSKYGAAAATVNEQSR